MARINFSDTKYLQNLLDHLEAKVRESQSSEDRALMLSGASMNWIADFLTDENVEWHLETLPIDSLVLTGTNPEWNDIIINQAQRQPAKLREILEQKAEVRDLFAEAKFSEVPILVRKDQDYLKIVDGMHRTIAAIRDGKEIIQALVAISVGPPKPHLEAHVVYDLLKVHHRGLNKDRASLVVALRYLKNAYGNVENLLRNRFSKEWVPSDEIQAIIAEVLGDV